MLVPPLSLTFSRPFPKVDFWMLSGRPLAHFWLPFGSHWLPFGSRRLTFGSLRLIFGSLWLPFGSLLVSLGLLLVSIFSVLLYHVLIFRIFLNFPRKYHAKYCFKQFSLQITFSVNQIVFSRSAPNAPQRKIHPLFYNPSSRAQSGTFASGNLD